LKCQRIIHHNRSKVFVEPYFAINCVGERQRRMFNPRQVEDVGRLIANVELYQLSADVSAFLEVLSVGDARYTGPQVLCERIAVSRGVEYGIYVFEYLFFGDALVIILAPEFAQTPIGDVVGSLAPVL